MRTDVPHNMYWEEEELDDTKMKSVWEFVCQCLRLLQLPLQITGLLLSLQARLVCVYVFVCMCEAGVSHWSSSDPRALMWNPFNPCAQSVVGWGMISFSTAQLFLLDAPYVKQHVSDPFREGSGPSRSNLRWVLSLVQFIVLFFTVKVSSIWAWSKPRLFLMPCSAIYMVRWVTGECILLCMS